MAEKFATQWNHTNNSSETRGVTAYVSRFLHIVGGGNLVDFQCSFSGWFFSSGSSGSLTDLTNDYTIVKMSIEHGGVMYLPTFSGVRNKTIVDGDNDIRTDTINVQTAWGKPYLVIGDEFWIKLEITVPLTTDKIPFSPRTTSDASGSQVHFYDTGATTLNNATDSAGAYTFVGSTQSRSSGHTPWIIGNYTTNDTICLTARGDSITAGTGDATTSKYGRGWFQRMIQLMTVKPSSWNGACHGSTSLGASTDARWTHYYQYCTHGFIFYLTNDFASNGVGTTVAIAQTRLATIYNTMIAAGMQKVGLVCTLVRATSTDSWATEENQTVNTGWNVGDRPEECNTAIKAAYDIVIPMDSIRGTARAKWIVTSPRSATDDTHPSFTGATLMANEALAYVNELIVSDESAGTTAASIAGSGMTGSKIARVGISR